MTRTIRLASSSAGLSAGGGERRYAVNWVSFVEADTPLKLADYFNISGVFRLGGIPDAPPPAATGEVRSETAVMDSDHRSFVEVVLENGEGGVQSWHLDGHSVFVVGTRALDSTFDMTPTTSASLLRSSASDLACSA